MKCFIDTSAFVALYRKNDTYHHDAASIWRKLKEQDAVLYTTRDVLSETITLVRRREGFHRALICGDDLWESPVLEVVWPNRNQDNVAWALFRKYSDKELISYVDCVSFAVMKELRLRLAFTFDKNFEQVGFEAIRV